MHAQDSSMALLANYLHEYSHYGVTSEEFTEKHNLKILLQQAGKRSPVDGLELRAYCSLHEAAKNLLAQHRKNRASSRRAGDKPKSKWSIFSAHYSGLSRQILPLLRQIVSSPANRIFNRYYSSEKLDDFLEFRDLWVSAFRFGSIQKGERFLGIDTDVTALEDDATRVVFETLDLFELDVDALRMKWADSIVTSNSRGTIVKDIYNAFIKPTLAWLQPPHLAFEEFCDTEMARPEDMAILRGAGDPVLNTPRVRPAFITNKAVSAWFDKELKKSAKRSRTMGQHLHLVDGVPYYGDKVADMDGKQLELLKWLCEPGAQNLPLKIWIYFVYAGCDKFEKIDDLVDYEMDQMIDAIGLCSTGKPLKRFRQLVGDLKHSLAENYHWDWQPNLIASVRGKPPYLTLHPACIQSFPGFSDKLRFLAPLLKRAHERQESRQVIFKKKRRKF